MKRVLYGLSAVALITSFGLANGRTFAAQQRAHHAKAKTITVRLCSSTPHGVPALAGISTGIWNGAVLATAEWKAKFKKIHVNLASVVKLDYAKSDGSGYDPAREQINASKCLSRSDTYAYIGTLNSGAAKVSEPILNKGGMAMISPANTNIYLTSPTRRGQYQPATASGKVKFVTYYRTVTTDALQGAAGALVMKSKYHVKTYYLVDDQTEYGAGLALGMDTRARKIGMTRVGKAHIDPTDSASIQRTSNSVADNITRAHPQAVYCGCDSETSFPLPKRLRRNGFNAPYFGGDAIYNASWVSSKYAGAGSKNNYATSVVPPVSKTSSHFSSAYKKMFHIAIEAYDAPSYDAATAALTAIYDAAKAGKLKSGSMFKKRTAILPYLSKVHFTGATGRQSFDKNGDTNDRLLYLYRVVGKSWKVVGRLPAPPGAKPTV